MKIHGGTRDLLSPSSSGQFLTPGSAWKRKWKSSGLMPALTQQGHASTRKWRPISPACVEASPSPCRPESGVTKQRWRPHPSSCNLCLPAPERAQQLPKFGASLDTPAREPRSEGCATYGCCTLSLLVSICCICRLQSAPSHRPQPACWTKKADDASLPAGSHGGNHYHHQQLGEDYQHGRFVCWSDTGCVVAAADRRRANNCWASSRTQRPPTMSERLISRGRRPA